MSYSLRALASSMVLRNKAGTDPYVLFLGAGAFISSRCSSMTLIVNDVLKEYTRTYYDEYEVKIEKSFRKTKK